MNVADLLEEAISDKHLKSISDNKKLKAVLEMARVAIPAVLTAGAAGNVTCKVAAVEVLKISKRLS